MQKCREQREDHNNENDYESDDDTNVERNDRGHPDEEHDDEEENVFDDANDETEIEDGHTLLSEHDYNQVSVWMKNMLKDYLHKESEETAPEVRRSQNGVESLEKTTLDLFLDYHGKLNEKQRKTFNIVAAHLTGHECVKTEKNPEGQLRMLISGEGGTGKSFLIDTIKYFTQLTFPHDHTKVGSVSISAPTGKAALNVKGDTVHKTFDFTFLARNKNKFTPKVLEHYQKKFANVKLIIMDEVSMIGPMMLNKIHKILSAARPDEDLQPGVVPPPLGGIHMILAGDFYQLNPVKDVQVFNRFHQDLETKREGIRIYNQIDTFCELLEQKRQTGSDANEERFRQMLGRARKGQVNDDDIDYINNRSGFVKPSLTCAKMLELPKKNSMTVTHRNGKRATANSQESFGCFTINGDKMRQMEDQNSVLQNLWAHDTFGKTKKPRSVREEVRMREKAFKHKNDGTDEQTKLEPLLTLTEGARIMLHENLCTKYGLVNGAMGTVNKIVWCAKNKDLIKTKIKNVGEAARNPPRTHPILMIEFDELSASIPRFKSRNNTLDNLFPLPVTTKRLTDSVNRTQFPINPAECLTIHKAQGQTVENITLVADKGLRRGMLYVALSRAKTSKGVHIILHEIEKLCKRDFNCEDDSGYALIHAEYDRLRKVPAKRAEAITEALGVDIDFSRELAGMTTFESESDNMLV